MKLISKMRYLGSLSYSQTNFNVFLLIQGYARMFEGWVFADEVENDTAEHGNTAPDIEAAGPTDRWCREITGTQ